MNAEFEKQLRYIGVKAEGIRQLDAWLEAHDYVITWDWRKADARDKALRAERKATAQAAAVAAATPYTGPAMFCQASVADGGRSVGFHRCGHAAKLVVKTERDDQYGGKLAVCKAHAKDSSVFRYTALWRHEHDASEPVS